MVDKKAISARVVQRLKKLFDDGGRGTTRRVEKEIGRAKGYFSKWFSSGTFDFFTLLEALEVLEADPWDFFTEICRGNDSEDDEDAQAAAKPRNDPRRIRPRLQAGIPETSGVPQWIVELDELRYRDPESAIRKLWARVDEAGGAAIAHYLGTLGSAYRSIGNLPEARDCLSLAEMRAQDDLGFGDALQRLSYLALYEGDPDRALTLAEQAAGVFARAGLWVRFGETHVEQAQFLGHLGETRLEWRSLGIASNHLHRKTADEGPRLRRYLFALEQYRAVNRRKAGSLGAALKHAQAALETAPSPVFEGFAWGVTGAILRDLGQLDDAARAFQAERERVGDDPYNALAATLEIVDCLARARRFREAVAEAESTVALLGSLDASSPVRAATMLLWAQARSGRLARSTVQATREAIQRARAGTRPACHLGCRIRRIRRMADVSRPEVAAQAGVPVATLRRVETGECTGTKHVAALEAWLHDARPENRLESKPTPS